MTFEKYEFSFPSRLILLNIIIYRVRSVGKSQKNLTRIPMTEERRHHQ